jgi:hypothetical protein
MLTGTPSPAGGTLIDMPFGRDDLADYLSLNPDTLSRIVARLRRTGILGHSRGAGRWCATSAPSQGSRPRHARLPTFTGTGAATG